MNIIFLDVDGVINSINHTMYCKEVLKLKKINDTNYPFDEEALMNLKYLVDITDAGIVITSTWRLLKKHYKVLMDKLKEYDLEIKVVGITPDLNKNKKEEILSMINEYNIDNFIVLDDADIDIPFLIKVNRYTGLSRNDTKKGIKILTKTRW